MTGIPLPVNIARVLQAAGSTLDMEGLANGKKKYRRSITQLRYQKILFMVPAMEKNSDALEKIKRPQTEHAGQL